MNTATCTYSVPCTSRILMVPPLGAFTLTVKALAAKSTWPHPVSVALCDDPLELIASMLASSRKPAVFAFLVAEQAASTVRPS